MRVWFCLSCLISGMGLSSLVNGAMVRRCYNFFFLWASLGILLPMQWCFRTEMTEHGTEWDRGKSPSTVLYLWNWSHGGCSGDHAFAWTLALIGWMWSAVAGGELTIPMKAVGAGEGKPGSSVWGLEWMYWFTGMCDTFPWEWQIAEEYFKHLLEPLKFRSQFVIPGRKELVIFKLHVNFFKPGECPELWWFEILTYL